MAVEADRLYETDIDMSNALVEAIRNRDKTQVAMIGLYALTTEHEYPTARGVDFADYIWQIAHIQLGRMQDPDFDSYFDQNFPQTAA